MALSSTKYLEAVRNGIQRSVELVSRPSPQVLTQCIPLLEEATSELRKLTGMSAGPVGQEPDVLQGLLSLRKDLDRLRALLGQAARFHDGWQRVRDTRTGGYAPDGEPRSPGLRKRVLAEG